MKTLKTDGGFVEVCSNARLPEPGKPNRVGLIAQPRSGRGWVELSTAAARALAADLLRAADETDATLETPDAV